MHNVWLKGRFQLLKNRYFNFAFLKLKPIKKESLQIIEIIWYVTGIVKEISTELSCLNFGHKSPNIQFWLSNTLCILLEISIVFDAKQNKNCQISGLDLFMAFFFQESRVNIFNSNSMVALMSTDCLTLYPTFKRRLQD